MLLSPAFSYFPPQSMYRLPAHSAACISLIDQGASALLPLSVFALISSVTDLNFGFNPTKSSKFLPLFSLSPACSCPIMAGIITVFQFFKQIGKLKDKVGFSFYSLISFFIFIAYFSVLVSSLAHLIASV